MEGVILTVRLDTGAQSVDVETSLDTEVVRLAEQVALAKGWMGEVDGGGADMEVYYHSRTIRLGETLGQIGVTDGAVLTVRLRVVDQRGASLHSVETGKSYLIRGYEAVIGRFGPDVLAADKLGRLLDMSKEPQGATVSRLHARIVLIEGRWHLIPEKTTNPTRVNGKPVDPGVPFVLRHGDAVQLGAVTLQFRT